jgi:hypothetical protein
MYNLSLSLISMLVCVGSFFAGIYALWHWGKIFETAHSPGRKIALLVENIYLTINLLFSWFAIVSHILRCFDVAHIIAKTCIYPRANSS